MDCTDPNVPTSIKCIPFFILNLSNALFALAGITAVFFIIFGGLRFLTSGGDPVKVEMAKRTLTFATVGLVIVVLAFFIVRVVATVTNTSCINIFSTESCQ